MHVAIIGAGVAGLTAAYRLQSRHRITLFEAHDYLGGHVNTVDVADGDQSLAIDTGFIVFNDRTYPNFIALLDELGVASQPTSMSFSVRCERSGLEYNGSSLNGLFAQRRNLFRPGFLRMLRDIVRFNREASTGDVSQWRDNLTVGEFLARGRYSDEFAEHYLLPMGAAIWSCPLGAFARFPLRFIVEFYRHHGLLSLRDRPTWRVVRGGSRTYVGALAKQLRGSIRMATPIARVRRQPDCVEITPRGGSAERFDHVVFACHADQALRMLADASNLEREVLGEFPYQRNTAVLHTDTSLLPRHRRAWACWNYRLPRQRVEQATVTYCMNLLQGLSSSRVFCVTLNDDGQIDPRHVLRRFVYEHPTFTTRRAAAQARHGELLVARRTSYCGAYWRNGFHEDGVVSAQAVCRALNTLERLRVSTRLSVAESTPATTLS